MARGPTSAFSRRLTEPRERRARRRRSWSTRSAWPRRRRWMYSSGGFGIGWEPRSLSIFTATTTSAWPPPRRSRRYAPARPGCTARSTAWASAPETRTSVRSRSRSAPSTERRRTFGSNGSAKSRSGCASSRGTSSSRGSRLSAKTCSRGRAGRSRASSTTHPRLSHSRPRSSEPSVASSSERRAASTAFASSARSSGWTSRRTPTASCSRTSRGWLPSGAASSRTTSSAGSPLRGNEAAPRGMLTGTRAGLRMRERLKGCGSRDSRRDDHDRLSHRRPPGRRDLERGKDRGPRDQRSRRDRAGAAAPPARQGHSSRAGARGPTRAQPLAEGARVLIVPCDVDSARSVVRAARGHRVLLLGTCNYDPALVDRTASYWGSAVGANVEMAALADYLAGEGFSAVYVTPPDEPEGKQLERYFRV